MKLNENQKFSSPILSMQCKIKMGRKRKHDKILVLLITLTFLLGCLKSEAEFTEEDAIKLAKAFVENSSTYVYDGYDLRLLSTKEHSYYWDIVFIYTSKHMGYGNRTNDNPPPKRTLHRIKVRINKFGRIIGALVDNKYDELERDMARPEVIRAMTLEEEGA